MEAIDKFRIEPIAGGTLHSRLAFDKSLSLEVAGVTIEAQFRCSRGYLVVTSDGNPYEEIIHFYLLSEGGEVLDELSLGRIYHSGTLRDVVPHAGDRLEFSFFGRERWCLSILDKARLQPPSLFSSVRRKGWSHYLSLQKNT